MKTIQKSRLLLTLFMWALAVFCAYETTLLLLKTMEIPEFWFSLPPLYWGYILAFLTGVFLYTLLGIQVLRNTLSVTWLRVFQIFSGILAGLYTDLPYLLAAWLFSNSDMPPLDYYLVTRTALFVAILAVAIMVTRITSRQYGIKWLLRSFVAVVALLFLQQVMLYTGLGNAPLEFFIAMAALAASMIFFPRATTTVLTVFMVFCFGIFNHIGRIMRR